MLAEQCDEGADFSAVRTLELCFRPIHSLGTSLSLCTSLRELELTRTHTRDFSGLSAVAKTLERLTISEQSLEEVPAVVEALQNLRFLFLNDNGLRACSRIGGLKRLHTLWLSANELQSLDGFEGDVSGSLRVLMLQGNRIPSLSGVEKLSVLAELNVGGNPIADRLEILRLARMPALRSVTFDDSFYAACPVAERRGYKSFVLRKLRQILVLDGKTIAERDRTQVRTLLPLFLHFLPFFSRTLLRAPL